MWKPLFGRKASPKQMAGDWMIWRWFDIFGRDGGSGDVYLRRLYVFKCPWFSVLIHRIKQPDPDRHPHDHPWDFVSFILRGWYQEWSEHETFEYTRPITKSNRVTAEKPHRIVNVSPDCLTLVITGPKKRSWGFHTEDGWIPWRDYICGE